MIIDSFDDKSEAKINPKYNEDAFKVDACILTFSNIIEEYILKNFECEKIGTIKNAADTRNIYLIKYKEKKIAFYKTFVGAVMCVGSIETLHSQIKTDKFIVFGGAGCLNKEIAHGKVMIPTEAYRDEGTSYHYEKASDYINIKNCDIVAQFMKENEIPFVLGKTWTTDGPYRETENNIKARKDDGCISVEMECSALQAMCNFRGLNFYTFFTSGDLLDAPKWDKRAKEGELEGTQHDIMHFKIALELTNYIIENSL